MLFRSIPTVIFVAGLFLSGYTQQRGNIVEYFGRERVEQIEEGAVFHVFSEGLTLPLGPGGGGVVPSRDIIAWHFSNGTFRTPRHGEFLHPVISPQDSMYVWEKLDANEEGLFQSRNMRRAYLYTSLQSPREEIVLLDAKGHTRVYINGLP